MRFLRLDELGWDALAFAWGSHELMQGPAGLKRVRDLPSCETIHRKILASVVYLEEQESCLRLSLCHLDGLIERLHRCGNGLAPES